MAVLPDDYPPTQCIVGSR